MSGVIEKRIADATAVYLATKLIATGKGLSLREPSRYSLIDFEPKSFTFFLELVTSSMACFLLSSFALCFL